MQVSERTLLLETTRHHKNINNSAGLSVLFSIICIVDVFGVFPVVTLPKAVIDCGYYGILVVAAVCSIQMYTAILLGKCWMIAAEIHPLIHRKNRYPYAALAELTYGRTLSSFVTLLLDVTVFGAGIPNLILASQNLQLLGLRLSDARFDMSYCYWIIVMGAILCPLMWLGSPKDMKWLCSVSAILVGSVFLLVNGCLIFSTPSATTPSQSANNTATTDLTMQERPLWELILTLYGIIAFQFDIHPNILTIQVDMTEKKRLSRAILGGFAVSLGMFAVTGANTAVKYSDITIIRPSILQTIPASLALDLAAALVALQLCLTSGVSNNALYQHMEDCMGISRDFNHRRCVLRTTLTLLAILLAESVPRFDLVMSLIGGTLTGPLVFMLPPLFYMRLLCLRRKYREDMAMESFQTIVSSAAGFDLTTAKSKYLDDQFRLEFEASPGLSENVAGGGCCDASAAKLELFLCILIIGCSVCLTITTTYINVVNAVDYASFSQPCIFNVSAALIYL